MQEVSNRRHFRGMDREEYLGIQLPAHLFSKENTVVKIKSMNFENHGNN